MVIMLASQAEDGGSIPLARSNYKYMLRDSDFAKLRIMVPVENANAIREALGKAGAGVQCNYTNCTGSHRQIGRFKPMAGASPAIGEVGKLVEVEEEVIETLCRKDLIKHVIEMVKKVHPYEEPAIDILPRFEVE